MFYNKMFIKCKRENPHSLEVGGCHSDKAALVIWGDKFFCYDGSANCPSSSRIQLYFNSTGSAVYPSYTFVSNAAQLNYFPGGEFTTGS